MKKVNLLMACLASSIGVASAQTQKVTGQVISAEDGMPVIGAAIIVKGTSIGTVSDLDGKFSLEVPADAKTIFISYVGLKTKEMPVASFLNVKLESDSQALDEVVVTAMGISREKKSLGYAIQEVGAEELTKAGQISVTGALSGKVAGVQVNQFGGSVGASSRISVRGNSSLSADQQPLIVVDGVPISNAAKRSGDNTYNGVDYGSGLNDINPEDIESMTVLKGGSAALYGMRAGNGVILITTKSGKKSGGVKVMYDGNFTVDKISTMPKLQNSYGQGNIGDEYHWKLTAPNMSYQEYAEQYGFNWVDGSNGINDFYDESWGPRLDAGLNLVQYDSNGQKAPWISRPNNVKDFFQTGYSMNHTISLAANSDKASTRASLSFRDQKGTVPNTDQKRYSAQLNSSIKLNKYISYDLSTSYTRTKSDNLPAQGYGGNNPINSLVAWSGRQINMQTLKDNWDQKDANGNYTMYNWNNNYHINPYFNVYMNTNSYQRDRIFGKSSLYYQPFEWLKFEGRAGVDYYNSDSMEKHYKDLSDWTSGGFEHIIEKNTELNLDFMASFNKTFGDWNVTAMAGANYRDVSWSWDKIGATALTVPGVYTIANKSGDAITSTDHSHKRSNSVYGNVSIGWKNQLYLDASARNDWDSSIKDAFFYPSVSMSWIATETFPQLKGEGNVLSFLKLRGGWAEIGSATSAYRNRAYYYMDTSGAFNGVAQIYKSSVYPNPDLRPESIKTWEVGAEFGFLHDRLHLDMAYYHKTTTDQILNVTIPYSSGYGAMLINAGEIQNKGVEIQVSGDILQSKQGLNWSSTLNFSKDKSKVISLYPELGLNTYGIGWTWGIATQAREGEEWGALVSTGYSRVTEDDVKAGTATADQIGAVKVNSAGLASTKSAQVIGNVTPDFLMNWRNDFSIQNVSFGFLLDLRVGGDIWSQSMSHGYTAGTAEITAADGVRERAIVAGKDVATNERFVMKDASGKWVENTIETDAQTWYEAGGNPEMYVFDGSFLKLREMNVSYRIPKPWLAKTRYISDATVSFIANNLWLIWVHSSNTMRLDPETGGVSSDSRGVGFEQASIPSSRSFGLKVNLTF